MQVRTIKSFTLRSGRMSVQQKQSLGLLWPKYGLSVVKDEQLDFITVFTNAAPKVVLEIGFGNGVTLADMAAKNPAISFLGIEVYTLGISNLMQLAQVKTLSNLRIIQHDAVEILRDHIANHTLDKVQIFFPDPWPKLRHHKRRLINPVFIDLLANKITPGGILHVATDWEAYAKQILHVVSNNKQFTNCAGNGNFSSDRLGRIVTKFEQRGLILGHKSWDLIFKL